MKKLFLACIVFCGLAASAVAAVAADVPVLAPYQPPPLRPLYSWTGCYLGFNIGAGAAYKSWADTDGTFFSPGASLGNHNGHGAVGGGQIGCDYQTGPFVFGIQGLYDLTGMKGDNVQPDFFLLNHSFVQTVATLTGRVGYTVTPTMLLYVKAGGAWAHDLYNVSTPSGEALAFNSGTFIVSSSPTGTFPVIPATILALGNKTTGGWTVGAGFEWAFFGGDWSAFLEYDYMDFGTSRVTLLPTVEPGPPIPIDIRQTVNMILFGINYRFYGGAPRF